MGPKLAERVEPGTTGKDIRRSSASVGVAAMVGLPGIGLRAVKREGSGAWPGPLLDVGSGGYVAVEVDG